MKRTSQACSTGTLYRNTAHVKRGAKRQAAPVAIRKNVKALMDVRVVGDSVWIPPSLLSLDELASKGSLELGSDGCGILSYGMIQADVGSLDC
jgi:hypothetical protein